MVKRSRLKRRRRCREKRENGRDSQRLALDGREKSCNGASPLWSEAQDHQECLEQVAGEEPLSSCNPIPARRTASDRRCAACRRFLEGGIGPVESETFGHGMLARLEGAKLVASLT